MIKQCNCWPFIPTDWENSPGFFFSFFFFFPPNGHQGKGILTSAISVLCLCTTNWHLAVICPHATNYFLLAIY